MARYVPKQGDFVVVNFDPQSGHEQKGRRPALVVSNTLFNKHTGWPCCARSRTRGAVSRFTSPCRPASSSLTGYIMVEQIKSVDYASRKAKFVEKAPRSVLEEVLSILDACVYDSA